MALSVTARTIATTKATAEWKTSVPSEVRKMLKLTKPKGVIFVWKYSDQTQTVIFEASKAPEEPKGRFM